jgi:hypothetical protein
MAKAEANISMALAGFVTRPDLNRYPLLAEGGGILHTWLDESCRWANRREADRSINVLRDKS